MSATPTHGKKLTIGFGLVNVALAIKPLHESKTRPGGKFLDAKNLHPVKQVYKTSDERIIGRDEIVTGYAAGDDTFVLLDDAVVETLCAEKTGRMEISKTVPFNEVDPAHLSSTYLCWPQTGSETAFDLLAEVLRGSGSAAVATVVLTKTTQQVILRWSEDLEVILVHICEFSNAIRTNDVNLVKDAASKRTVDPAMVEVAKTLLSSLEGTFDATEVEDTYGAALTEAISNATNGVTAPVTKTEKKVAAADDLLEALKASVAASTKAKVKA